MVLFLTLYPPQCLGHVLNSDHSENLQTWTSHVTSHFCVVSGIKPNWWIQNSSGTASFRSMHLTTTKSKSSSWSCCLNSSVRVQVWIGGFTNPKGCGANLLFDQNFPKTEGPKFYHVYRSFTDLFNLLTSGSVPAATLLVAVREDASAPGRHVPAVGHALRQVSAHSGLPQLRTHPPSRFRLIQDEPSSLLIRTESSLL